MLISNFAYKNREKNLNLIFVIDLKYIKLPSAQQ